MLLEPPTEEEGDDDDDVIKDDDFIITPGLQHHRYFVDNGNAFSFFFTNKTSKRPLLGGLGCDRERRNDSTQTEREREFKIVFGACVSSPEETSI